MARRPFADWRIAVKTILAFWAVYYGTVIVRALLGGDPETVIGNKAIAIIAGILITFVVYLAGAALGPTVELPGRGLIGDPVAMLVLAVGSVAVMMPKHLLDTLKPADPPRSRR